MMIRAVILYAVVVFSLRLMGKKQLGELQPSELVTTILISNIATMSLEDTAIPMLLGIVPILAIVCIDVLVSVIMMNSARFRRFVAGSPRVIISEGTIDQKELKRLRYTVDDILESMREQGIFDINDVRYAIVETTGKINFCKTSDGTCDPPGVIIRNGMTDEQGVKQTGIKPADINAILNTNGIRPGDVFLLTVSKNGEYSVIKREA